MEGTKTIGIWLRVSTEFQVKDDSPEHHEKRARLYAEAKGWNVKEVYRLDAISGKSVMDQPETKRMLKDIRSGAITGLIFSKLARLARNTKELIEFSEIFRTSNADLISLSESIDTSSPAGRLFYTMIAAMATWEREEIADRVAASVPIRAKLGKPLGGQASFGYRWDGKDLVVDEKEAPIRKLIYELFLKYKRKKVVANELNNMGYRTRNGSNFSDTTIDRLLRDSTAKGQRIANHTRSTGDGKKWVRKPSEDWVIIPCPQIVSEEIWNECNAILDAQYKKQAKPSKRTQYLLAGFINCHCGHKMYVYHKAPVFFCKNCKNKIAVSDIEEIYQEQLKSFLLSDSDLQSFHNKSNSILAEKGTLLEHLQSESKKVKKKMDDLLTLRLDGDMSKDLFPIHYKPLEERYLQIEDQIPEIEAEIDFLKIQQLSSDTVQSDAKNLFDQWENLPFEEKRTIVETLTDHITVDKEDIAIKLSYIPILPIVIVGNGQRNSKDSLPPAT